MNKKNDIKNIRKYIKKDIKDISIIFKLITSILILTLATSSNALIDENIKWSSEGNTYRLTPADNTFTEKEYTIKAVEFPSPVRGERTIYGGIRPERPIVPFVGLELYKDIINNSEPIDIFVLGIGDEYVTANKELRITIDSVPDGMSQDWVYQYYNPWVIIRTQKRSVPNLDIQINLNIDEEKIKSGDDIRATVRIKNTGEDVINSVSFNIDPDSSLLKNVMITNTLKDTINQLNKDEERITEISLKVPIFLEEKEYEIRVNVTGHDVNNVIYNFNVSKKISVKGDIEHIYVEKLVSRNTIYLKEYVSVVLNVVNRGSTTVSDIRINDAIPSRLILIKDGTVRDYKEFSLNKSSIEPSDSWTITYNLKPTEPGIYILPKFDANFSAGGKELTATSNEVGFRIFGPKVILYKSAIDLGNGLAEVIVTAKNIGNILTKVVIEDQLPEGVVLISGKMNLTTSLDRDTEKTMNYTIKVSDDIANLTWPPAKARYYLDDWKFNTSSDEKYEEGHIVEEDRQPEAGTKTRIVIITPATISADIYPEVAAPEIEESKKKVVATIPAKTPTKIPEKSTPGFTLHDILFGLFALILSGVLLKYRRKYK